MADYRLIGCSVGDYDSNLSFGEIVALDENDRGYFFIHESDSLNELRLAAIRHCREWWESDLELADEVAFIGITNLMVQKIDELADLTSGSVVPSVASTNDWVRIERAE